MARTVNPKAEFEAAQDRARDLRDRLEENAARRQAAAASAAAEQADARQQRLLDGLKRIPINWKEEVRRGRLVGVDSAHSLAKEARASAAKTLKQILAEAERRGGIPVK